MQHWFVATLTGAGLGLALYGCVRLRVWLGPRIGDWYGQHMRRAYWVLTVVIMVILANIALWGLRRYLQAAAPSASGLLLESWFALLALVVGLAPILVRARRSSRRNTR